MQKPYVHTIYVSEEAYDKLVEAINAPPDPKVVERLKQIMSKPADYSTLRKNTYYSGNAPLGTTTTI
jgi:hypothetical protein